MAYDYQDPSQGWYGDYSGYDEYGGYEDEYEQEETESMKQQREQELIEAIESNRLYLKKFRKRCVQEDFVDLEKTQMYLFEFLIESLQINSKSELGLVPEEPDPGEMEIVARVQFQDTPYIEIREKGERMEGSDSVMGQTEYFETVGNAGLQDAVEPIKSTKARKDGSKNGSNNGSIEGSVKDEETSSGEHPPSIKYDTMWENPSGKSLLFSKSVLEILEGLDKSPVKVQVSNCLEPVEEDGEITREGTCEPIGYALIRLPEHFNLSVLQSCKSGVILPVSCIHRETCDLINVFGVKKGEMQVFIRLSCFGNVITTSFQSVGPERRYVFKPSPLPEATEEPGLRPDMLLKPIIAEEQIAKGVRTVVEDEDPFQKSVVWKNNSQNCGCLDEPLDICRSKESSLRMPRSSDASLCRDAIPPLGRSGKPYCDWHDLVGKGIQNSPGGNCGCLDGFERSEELLFEGGSQITGCCHASPPEPASGENEGRSKPSRIEKMRLITRLPDQIKPPKPSILPATPRPEKPGMLPKVPEKLKKPITGPGIKPEPTHCDCDCGPIRESLKNSPMMKYTWQVN